MDGKMRERLIRAAIESRVENLKNLDPLASFESEVRGMLRFGAKGYAQMSDAELVEKVKDESGWADVAPAQRRMLPEGGTAWLALIKVIDEVV